MPFFEGLFCGLIIGVLVGVLWGISFWGKEIDELKTRTDEVVAKADARLKATVERFKNV